LYSKEGKNIGGYNRIYEGWQQFHATIYPGIRINGTSQDGGGQLELGLKFQLFQGRWWFGVNNRTTTDWIWLGFYPASLFQHGLATQAVREIFGGEVFATAGNPCSTTDQMGSGRHAAAGWTHAAYQRNLRVLDINQNQQDFNGTALVDAPPTCSTSRYTIDTHMKSGSTWGSYQFFGGTAN
jgi:hypothetical protein